MRVSVIYLSRTASSPRAPQLGTQEDASEADVMANFDFLQNDIEEDEENDDDLDDGGSADDESDEREDEQDGRRKRAKQGEHCRHGNHLAGEGM